MPDRKLLISIHDVTPATLGQTESILERLAHQGLLPATLLLVPNRDWESRHIEKLNEWLLHGRVHLAGHGWNHHTDRISGLKHWLHSQFISQNVAEHLAVDRWGRLEIIQRCYRWFEDHSLPIPCLYVPPAWALGSLPRDAHQSIPFALIETLTGVYNLRRNEFIRSPMSGFEAHNVVQSIGCRVWNGINNLVASKELPLRVAIHPGDFQLRLRNQLSALLAEGGTAVSYQDQFAVPSLNTTSC